MPVFWYWCPFVSRCTWHRKAGCRGPPTFEYELPAGLACSFKLYVAGYGSAGKDIIKEDKNGNVRTISPGKGFDLTFVNLETAATYSLKANGSVLKTTTYADGSYTAVATGHNVIILLPTDVPAGPSTTLYVGRVVYTVDPDGVFTIQSVTGKTTDICAALS